MNSMSKNGWKFEKSEQTISLFAAGRIHLWRTEKISREKALKGPDRLIRKTNRAFKNFSFNNLLCK